MWFLNLEASESTASSRSEQKEVLCSFCSAWLFLYAFLFAWILLRGHVFVVFHGYFGTGMLMSPTQHMRLFPCGHGSCHWQALHINPIAASSVLGFGVILTIEKRVLLAAFDNLKLLPVSCDTAYPRLQALSLTTDRPSEPFRV